jgi:hypothetical protein
MRVRIGAVLTALCMLAIASPVWAHGESTNLTIEHNDTIGNTTLKPGAYRFEVDPTKNDIKVMSKNRLVATIQGKWVDLKYTAPYSAVIITKDKIQEIQFMGKRQAIRVE